MPPSPASEELALAALEWIAGTAIADGDGVWWSGKPRSAEPDPTLYHGTAGIVLALLEAHAHFGDPRWGELARRGTGWLAAAIDTFDTARYPALYFGTAGTAFGLYEAAERLGDDEAENARSAAARGLAGVRATRRCSGSSPSWPTTPTARSVLPAQAAHGARGAGDANDCRAVSDAAGDSWRALADRCWHTVTASGLPERLRPGFWDNSGRCCETGGVLALALDREVEDADGLAFADLLVADLAHRSTVDAAGARWSNVEYRAVRPELEPRPGWAMGNAGLVRELLRHARITAGRDPTYAVQWPDHPATARAAAGRLAASETASSEG